MSDYGARLSKVDLRDYKVKAGIINVTRFELDDLPKVENQGSISSCVAHSARSILEWFNKQETNKYNKLSVGFLYGMQGVEFNRFDKGMYLRDVCKIIQKYGDCLFDTIPFNIEMPECYERLKDNLNKDVYDEALICKVSSYAKCVSKDAIKYALMSNSPVLMSIKWHDKYDLSDDGIINFDTTSDSGYHAIMVYGFNEDGWLCQNSWGENWGNHGRFILPYSYRFTEAWSFVDEKNCDVYKPKRNKTLDIIYKIINFIVNLFKKK